MKKLLIVDDEALTREGVRNSIPWEEFQIDTVLEAENGREGVEMAEKHRPEIILTDVRMPQLSGVDMAERIRAFLPDVSLIFMSGYSDKEYLKAAIRCKAVRYVEKPLNMLEIEEAVREAVSQYRETRLSRERHMVGEAEREQRVALCLSRVLLHGDEGERKRQARALEEECAQLGYPFTANTAFTVMILQFEQKHLSDLDTLADSALMERRKKETDAYIAHYGLKEVSLHKYDRFLIYFLFGSRPSEEAARRIANKVRTLYTEIGDLFLALGRSYTGVARAYDAYASAVVLMRSSFFYKSGSVITERDSENAERVVNMEGFPAAFTEILKARDKEAAHAFLKDMLRRCRGLHTLLVNQVKDEYYKLFMALENAVHAVPAELVGEGESILDIIDGASTLFRLHDALLAGTDAYFAAIDHHQADNTAAFAIKEYIARHYGDPMLSVKTIGDHVHRSAPYVCTLFKAQTGQTLNQYITEYRIEKAKRFLEDPYTKISEISSRVGYMDGNYFGKCFKKHIGLSPSEYREKMIG